MPDDIPSEAQVLEWMETLSNWGRWGDDDQMGCPNLITPAKRQQAASLVRDGVAVSCARPIVTDLTPDISHQVQRYMVDSGEGRDTDPEERRLVRRGEGRVHRHSISRPDHHSHRRFIPLFLAGEVVQRDAGLPDNL